MRQLEDRCTGSCMACYECSSLILCLGAIDGFHMVNHVVKVDFLSFQIYFTLFL